MKSIHVIEISVDELQDIVIKALKSVLNNNIEQSINDDEIIFSRTEAAQFLKISKVTLWDWTNKGKLKSYGIGNKVFYKKSEILSSLKQIS